MTARDIKQAAEPEPKPDHSPEGALSQRRFPSQNTQPKFVHWWIRANPRQRSLHLPMLFNHRVVVKSKAQVREMVENWFEHWVEEATPTPLPATEAA